MKSKGNGDPLQCGKNLFSIHRGEVPYDRLRGVNGSVIDLPANRVEGKIKEDIQWTVQRWEPRLSLESLTQSATDSIQGDFQEQITLKKKEGFYG